MGTPETSREPCPDRIFDDVGSAFGMGAVGGSAFHFIKGIYNSPNGHRLSGGAQFVRMNAPRVGGSFAVWGGLFSTLDCAMVYARQKEDPWNSIVAGAATGGLLSMRQGLLASGRSALVGGALLALIEGASIMINRVLVMPQDLPPLTGENLGLPAPVGFPGMPQASPVVVQDVAVPESGSTEWLGGLFRRKQEEKVAAGGGDRKSEMLESFDTPSAPIPTFEYRSDHPTTACQGHQIFQYGAEVSIDFPEGRGDNGLVLNIKLMLEFQDSLI